MQQLLEAKDFIVQASKVGSLVSGIVMFEVILLTLMGANNSGREIAAERLIFEKEKLSGLDPLAYILSKGIFLGVLVVAQSVWMGLFVSFVCSFPGDLLTQLLFLLLVNAAMTSVSWPSRRGWDRPSRRRWSRSISWASSSRSLARCWRCRVGGEPGAALHRGILELVGHPGDAESRAVLRDRADGDPDEHGPGGALPVGAVFRM